VISTLSGRVTHIDEQSLTLEVGGVGYEVNAPVPLLAEAHSGQSLSLHTYLVVRETEMTLYGFANLEARQLFTMLLGVNGVGPRLALAILSNLSAQAIRGAVAGKQPEVLSSVPGVGLKTAQKIVLHLTDKIVPEDGDGPLPGLHPSDNELLQALTGLGYSVVEAQTAMQSLPEDAPDELEERLKLALRSFSN
jgi:Holliday junction DNA helicase RuvA